MPDYRALQETIFRLSQPGSAASGIRRSEDGEWLSVLDLLEESGEQNPSRAYRMIVEAFPVLTDCFVIQTLKGEKARRKGPAVHQSHLSYLAEFFLVVLKPPRAPNPLEQMELSFPHEQDYTKPLPPGLPHPPPLSTATPSSGSLPSRTSYPASSQSAKHAREARAAFASSVVVACPPVTSQSKPSPSPYGWRTEKGRLSHVPREQLVVRLIERKYYSGATLEQIASELWHAGYHSRTGRRWTHKELNAIIKHNDLLWQRWADQQESA